MKNFKNLSLAACAVMAVAATAFTTNGETTTEKKNAETTAPKATTMSTVSNNNEDMVIAFAPQTPTVKFVKTKNRCKKSLCKCSGYWGIKHDAGTYEGYCRNTDGYGHSCGHGPRDHGLRQY